MNITAQNLRDKVIALADARITDPAAQITITPAEALYLAGVLDSLDFENPAAVESVAVEYQAKPTMNTTVSLDVSWQTASELRKVGIYSIRDLLECSEYDLVRLPGLSRKSLDELTLALRKAGVVLRRT